MNKNILVTGCSRGVGLEICRVLLREGNNVYGVARSHTDEFKDLEREYAGHLFFKSIERWRASVTVSEIFLRDVRCCFEPFEADASEHACVCNRKADFLD